MERCLAFVLALAACGPNGADTPADVGADGRALYAKYCALCHGAEGEGYAADNASQLANQDFLASASDTFLFVAIDRGRPGTAMAAYGALSGGPLAHAEVVQLIGYLRSRQTEPPLALDDITVQGDAARGAPLYARECADCHGDRGQGKTALSLANPLFLASASDGFVRHAIDHGRRDTPMRAFGGELDAQALDDLTRLIRSWASTVPAVAHGEKPPRFDRVIINPGGPAPSFALREGRFVAADDVKRALDRGERLVLLDARPTSDWLNAHIPGALPVPYYDADKMVDALPKDGSFIVAYCGCPHAASGRVVDLLRARDFPKTAVLDEGIFVWMQRGYPITYGSER